MKILYIITSLRTGGAEKLMVDLIPRLKERGLDVDLLLIDGTDTPFRKVAEEAGIRVYDLGKGGSVYSPIKFFKLIPFLRKYDIVHTHNFASQLFAAIGSTLCSVNLCTTEHSTSNRRRRWRWYAPIDRWMYRRYKRIICISAVATEMLGKHLGKSSNLITINNGIDTSKFINAKSSATLEEVAPGSRKIVKVAGFRKAKDHDTLIRSMKYLPDKFHLYLIGDGERRQELVNLAESEGLSDRVHFMGVRSDVAQLIHSADYVVMSSHYEGLSLSSVEGLASGRPFLASDVNGLREVVDGAGILFPHGEEKSLADEILRLEADPLHYNNTAERCRKRALDYDISKMVDGYISVYNSLK